ncbi:hypothetical protein [Streptomyces sp. NPDC002588]|uniref:hypothetical protein n=1 Tax=Streptomyces sp. NPDC002588 TaxID=3154419 RepID=UPI00331E6A15
MGNAHRRSWTDGSLTARSFLLPHRVARAVFHPAWIPEPLDPTVERLKRARVAAGFFAALGVHFFVGARLAWDDLPRNAATASAVLFCVTPLATGAMLLVWRRGGTVRRLRARLFDSLKLLSLFTASAFVCIALFAFGDMLGTLPKIVLSALGLWTAFFVIAGAVRLTGNFFGTAAVHRCLPPLLATVTTWLMAVPDIVTADTHGLGRVPGATFVLGAPVTVTAIALLETRRLRKRYGIRLTVHPATLASVPGPAQPTPGPWTPPATSPYTRYSAHNGRNPYGG